MKNKYLKMATSIGMAAIVLFSLSFANVPAANPVKIDDHEIQGVYGQGCLEDCALAAAYAVLAIKLWYYIPLAAVYAVKCATCSGDGGGGGYCDPCGYYAGSYQEGEAYICEYSGGQVVGQSACGGNTICCYVP